MKAGWPNSNPGVIDATAVSQLPNRLRDKSVGSGDVFVLETDYNFKDFFQFTMLEGDWFEYTDRDCVMVMNTRAMKSQGKRDRNLIGIIQDLGTPFNQPEPLSRYDSQKTAVTIGYAFA